MNATFVLQGRRPMSRAISNGIAILAVSIVFAAFAWDPASAVVQLAMTPTQAKQAVPAAIHSSASAASLEVIAGWEASAGTDTPAF